MTNFAPADWIELAKAIFYGIGIVCIPLATVYTMISAARVKRSEALALLNKAHIEVVSTNVDRLEKNTNSISERNQAIAMKLGITEGIKQERESVQANASSALAPAVSPVPVADEKTTAAVDRVADAIHSAANTGKKN